MTLEKTLVIVASIFAMFCTPSCTPSLSADNLATKPREAELQTVEKSADDVEAAKAKIEKLKKKFNFKTDTFTNETIYEHKKARPYFGLLSDSIITPVISGDILFVTTSLSNATYPETITIKIGDKVTTYESITAETTSEIIMKGTFYTTIFAFPDDSLLRQIASHAKEIDSDGISIRYSGRSGKYSDFYMHRYNKRSAKAVANRMVEVVTETLELYDALQIVKKENEFQKLQER